MFNDNSIFLIKLRDCGCVWSSFKTIHNRITCDYLIILFSKFLLNFKPLSIFYSAFILKNMYFILKFSTEGLFKAFTLNFS